MKVEFVKSAPDLAGRPEPVRPEFAFVGRSNCGKSSLINHFLQHTRLAHTSGKPGKTRLLNYFLVDDRYYVVDLPGYGYARVSKDLRARWWDLFKRFIRQQDRPLAFFHLLDARREPSPEDREVNAWLVEAGHPFALAVTKIDKVGTNSRRARYQKIIAALGLDETTPFFPTSARKHAGRQEMLAWVDALLAANEL